MLITNFASGELSPTLSGRIDLPQYYQGCSRLQNFEIIPTGGIERRTGTRRMMELDGNYRLIPFIVDKNRNFIFLINATKLIIYKYETNGNVTKQGEYTFKTSYASMDNVRSIQYAQNYDTIILVHRNYKPVLIEYKNNAFTVGEMDFDLFPDVELDDAFDFIMISDEYPVKQDTTDGSLKFTYTPTGATTPMVKTYEKDIDKVYCIKDGKLFEYTKTTAKWEKSGYTTDADPALFKSDGKYPGCVAFWNNRLYFASSNVNRQRVWASAAPDTRDVRYNDFNQFVRYITVNKVVKDADLHVFTCDMKAEDIDHSAKTFTLRNVSQDYTASGVLSKDITSYYVTGNNIPIGTKVKSCTKNTIVLDTDGVNITEDKNNEAVSIQLWRTASSVSADDYEYQVVANEMVTADCSFYFDIASSENDAIMFLCPNNVMAIGTESSIWSLSPDASAVNLSVSMQGRYGSDDLQALSAGSASIYFAQGKKAIREFYYNAQQEAFQTNDIAILAKQMLEESAAIDFDYITNPYSKLIIARDDGTAAQLLYDKNNGILGWSRIVHASGKIKNVAVVRGYDQWDISFYIVERTEGTESKYSLEVIDPGQKIYMDSWEKYDGRNTGYNDNAVLYNKTKEKTCIKKDMPQDFIGTGDTVYIGYKYKSDIISMPVINGNEKRRIVALNVRFLNSYMPVMKITGVADEKFTGVKTPYSGIKKINYPGMSDYDVTFELTADDVKPVNILSVDAVLS